MTLFEKIKAKFKGSRTNPFGPTKHVIKPAFTVAGVQYFEFDTTANLPWKRGLKFLSVYNELDMKCDRFYLTKHVEAVKHILTGGKRVGLEEISKVLQLNTQMEERLQWIYHEDLIYKVASVVFFDANENPDDWEWGYALKKIEHWKKNEGVADFFLHEPMQRLIPFLNGSGVNIQSYSQTQKELDKAQLEKILAVLSVSPKSGSPTFTERYFWEGTKRNLV